MTLSQAKIAMATQGYVPPPQLEFFHVEFLFVICVIYTADNFIDQQIGVAVNPRTGGYGEDVFRHRGS